MDNPTNDPANDPTRTDETFDAVMRQNVTWSFAEDFPRAIIDATPSGPFFLIRLIRAHIRHRRGEL